MRSLPVSNDTQLLELLVETARVVHPAGELESLVDALLRGTLAVLSARESLLVLAESGAPRIFRIFADRPELGVELGSDVTWDIGAGAVGEPGDKLRSALALDRVEARLGAFEFEGGAGALIASGIDATSDATVALLARHAGNLIGNLRACQASELEARTDGLTGAMNYRHFMRRVDQEIESAHAYGNTFALLMVDVDNLKTYNDRYGHLGGSAALKELARLLEESARPADVIAKYGGDEFSILLPDCTLEAALRYSHDILERVERHCFEGDPYRRLTITVGVALFPEDGAEPRELLRQADDRLYRAKADGRNRIGIAHSRVIVRS